ncbi:MAG: metallophosphoesterase, partial [Crocinitomicaceae bacterium]|nr:metallophosphoesterase [Crocinitomicaceae bacterium]
MKISFAIMFLLSITSFGQQDSTLYSFFVAGHTFGNSGVNNVGFHPPFKQKFSYLQSKPDLELGILTGDIVSAFPIAQDWDEIDADISILGIPVYFAVGNHDMENRPLFESRYGATYYKFKIHNDLFIVLDPNIDGWNISGNQLQFLQNTLNIDALTSDNIFVFFHKVLWKEVDNQFSHIIWNSTAGRSDSINFWPEIVPLFHDLPNEVTLFAGDLGASWSSNVSY